MARFRNRRPKRAPEKPSSFESDPEHFKINRLSLDDDLLDQPHLVKMYSDELAQSKKDLAAAERALSVIEAKINLQIRRDPAEFDLPEKPTKDAVESTIHLQKTYQDAVEVVADHTHKIDLLRGAIKALDDKRRSLGEMVELLHLNYWAAGKTIKGDKSHRERNRERRARRRQTEE